MGQLTCFRRTFSATVLPAVGVLLLAAAGLKLYGLNVSPFAQYGWLTAPSVQTLAVGWEIVLGLWLLSGVQRIWAWAAAVGTFLTFAGVSGYLGWIGQANCGCFGVIKASPWHALTVDLSALILLVIARPNWPATRVELFRLPTGFAGVLLGAGLILVAMTGAATGVYGSPEAALARLQGSPVYAPGYADFGTGRSGDALERRITLTNWTDHPIRLIGGTSDCSCITTANLPATIGAGESIAIQIRLKVPGTATTGAFSRRVELWTDCDQQRTIRFVIGCWIE